MDRRKEEGLVRLALAEAVLAAEMGNPPFGAVLSDERGNPLLRARNTQVSSADPTAHAEINLLRTAARELGRSELGGLHVATNAEPCSMCMSALVKARVAAVHFGAPHEPHMDPDLPAAEVVRRSRHLVELRGGILAGECRAQIAAARRHGPPVD
jgi:tRNA(Arg) A34 adenosine deaminase TadA